MEEFLDKYKDKDIIIRALVAYLREKYKLTDEKISGIISERAEIQLPISIFKTRLSCLEIISIYLKDSLKLGFTRTAKLLNRSPKTIWGAYDRGKKKGWLINIKQSKISIPLSTFSQRTMSTLESIVLYLKDNHNLSFTQIALLLSRNVKTVWTTYKNGKRKLS